PSSKPIRHRFFSPLFSLRQKSRGPAKSSVEGGRPFLFPITRAYAMRQKPRRPPPLPRKAADPSPSHSPASRATPARRQLQRLERYHNDAGEPVLRCQLAARPLVAGGGPATGLAAATGTRTGIGFGRRR